MRRADRLFQIVQLLRGARVVTAAELARELEVSERTIYRDVADLVASGVPIEGEAGVGYAIPRGFDLPPLMFTADEIEAVVLGARIVEVWGGEDLAKSARSALSKVEAALPEQLKPRMEKVSLFAADFHVPPERIENLPALRRALTEKRKVSLSYSSANGEATERTIRPLGLWFWGTSWTLLAWCELREDFRNFRPDRMTGVSVLEEGFEEEPGRDLQTFLSRFGG